VQQEQQERQQKSTLKNEIAALKWQKKIRQTLIKNNKALKTSNSLSRVKSKRTRTVEAIQQNHRNHRALALKNIEQQHSQRRSSLQMRVEARSKKKKEQEAVAKGEADKTEMDMEKVVKEDRGKSMAAPDNSVEQTRSTAERTIITVEEHEETDASPVSNTLESDKLLKSVRLQQRIRRIKEVQMSRLRAKRLAKAT